ncbi:unnamed protein product [Rhodiola kirilowii]
MSATLHRSSSLLNSLPQLEQLLHKRSPSLLCTRNISFNVKSQLLLPTTTGRRNVLQIGAVVISSWVSILSPSSFAAESNKKGFLPVLDQKDGYEFLYPFGWQEIAIDGQDKVFKDVIEPLESVSVTVFPTTKQQVRELGPPKQVAEALIKKVLAPPTQKTKLIEAKEHEIDGRPYYTFEFVAQAPNYTRHALSVITIGNGKFYTLTTGANERRWGKMKDKLLMVVDSFKLSKF